MNFMIYLFCSLFLICSSINIQLNLNQQTLFKQSQNKQSNFPQGFVYVDQIDPTIINNLRYLTNQNFIGQPLIGYFTNRSIMTRQAAIALKNANTQFKKDGYQIVVYDSYRPQKTVDQFVSWSIDPTTVSQKAKYYPYIDKQLLFDLGYIAKKSGHTRGSTLDMSIIKIGTPLKPVQYKLRQLQDGRLIFLLDDNTQDMGSSFDLSDQASHPQNNTLILRQYMQKRTYLQNVMKRNGFRGIDTQWWHFTLQNEPFPNTYFNFDVK